MAARARAASKSAGPKSPRALVWTLRVLVGATGIVGLGLAGVEEATLGLAVAAAALIFCLTVLYRMVRVLGRPALEFDLERDAVFAMAGHKQLREERRRLLRAINELEFDHQMGKLSDADYKAVRHAYELRAVEVMRALEGEPELHPELRRELEARGFVGEAPQPPRAEPDEEDEAPAPTKAKPEKIARGPADGREQPPMPTAEGADAKPKGRACASCKGANEADAKFCKHCGKELVA